MVRATQLELYGNQIKVTYEDGDSDLAYPTTGGLWVIGGNNNIDPEPSDGVFSWPYPLDYVTSEFGPRGSGFHEGMDFAGGPAAGGKPIPATAAGTVFASGMSGGFGNRVIIAHGNMRGYDRYTLYAHMNATPLVNAGQTVTKGQVLGYIGQTGNSYGDHLHFETHRTPPGGGLVWANNNPSWTAGRTAIDPRRHMATFGDGGVIFTT